MIHAQGETETEHEFTVSNPVEAPQEQTLYDFVSTLLNDATARAEFVQDPAGVLERAGLGDITAEDVQDVVPLVMDYNEKLVGVNALGETESGVVNGLDGAIEQLRGVAEAVSERVDLEGTDLGSGFGGVSGGGAATPDGASGVLRYDTEAAGGEVTGRLTEDGLNAGSYTDSPVGQIAGMGGFGPESAGGVAGVDSVLGNAGSVLDVSEDNVSGAGSLDTEHLDASVFGAADDDRADGGVGVRTDVGSGDGSVSLTDDGYVVGGSVQTPFGEYGVEVTDDGILGIPEIDTRGDLIDNLDADTLTRSSEAAASMVATYVASGGAALHGTVRSAAEEVSGDLPTELPADVVPSDVPAALPTDVPAEVAEAAEAPAVDEEVLSEPRDSLLEIDKPIQVIDLDSNLPNVANAVYDLAGELHEVRDNLATLPNQLGFETPAVQSEMPDLPVANPMPDSAEDAAQRVSDGVERVADTVSDSPLGGIAEKGEDLLSDATGIDDLDLGH